MALFNKIPVLLLTTPLPKLQDERCVKETFGNSANKATSSIEIGSLIVDSAGNRHCIAILRQYRDMCSPMIFGAKANGWTVMSWILPCSLIVYLLTYRSRETLRRQISDHLGRNVKARFNATVIFILWYYWSHLLYSPRPYLHKRCRPDSFSMHRRTWTSLSFCDTWESLRRNRIYCPTWSRNPRRHWE